MTSWLMLGLVACVNDPVTGDPPADADADADTDSDTDTDADTDTAAACPVQWTPDPGEVAGCTALAESDVGEDGTVDATRVDVWDSAGRLSSVDWDFDGAPPVDIHETFVYDADGHLIERHTDDENDGTDDFVVSYSYDADGVLVEEVDQGNPPARWTWTAGPCGPETGTYDLGDDGVLEDTFAYTYTPTRASVEVSDSDGQFDHAWFTDFDAASGQPLHFESESDPDHAGPDYVTDYTYNADGQYDTLVSRSGGIVYTTTYAYDAERRAVALETLTDAGDSVLETTRWDCGG